MTAMFAEVGGRARAEPAQNFERWHADFQTAGQVRSMLAPHGFVPTAHRTWSHVGHRLLVCTFRRET